MLQYSNSKVRIMFSNCIQTMSTQFLMKIKGKRAKFASDKSDYISKYQTQKFKEFNFAQNMKWS